LLALVFAGLVAVTAVVILAVTWGASLRNSFDSANRQSIDLSEDLFTAIVGHLSPAEKLSEQTLTAIGAGTVDPADTVNFARWLMGGLAAVPEIRAAAVIRPDLSSWSVHRGEGRIVFEPVSRASRETIEAVFADAENRGGKPFWGDLVYVGGATLINLRAMFDWPGGGKGLLAIAISTTDLSRMLAEKSENSGWRGFILYDKSQVLAHEYIHRHPEALSASQPVLPLSILPDPTLRRIWDGGNGNFFQKAADAGTQVRFDPPDDPTHIYIVSRTERFGDTPWYYGAYTELEAVDAEVERALQSGVIALALAGVAVLVAIWIGHRLARPLRRSAEAAGQIGRLELDGFQPLPKSRVREFDQQATAFNQMAEGLRSFSTYVPKQLVSALARRGFRSDIPARKQEVTVLFTDIAGFTSQTEHMTAEETGRMLNEHFSLLGDVISNEQGVIDKYIGDSIMAFWVPALTDGDPAARAVGAARTIAALLKSDNQRRRIAGLPPIRVRIGIHTGPALVGNIGGKDRVDFTVVGDTVNIAQRLEGYGRNVDREADCVIVASDQTVVALPEDWPRQDLGELPIRGRAAAIRGWRILPEE
jgi:adenylate cyclase